MPSAGIDFGTTNSLIVAYDKKRHEFSYFNYDGERPSPTSSTIWYHDSDIIVGTEARQNIHRYSEVEGHHFEKSIKLKLGTEYTANVFGQETSASMVAAEILKHLRKEAIYTWQADKAGVDLRKAVFTVPINFTGKARRDLREAANEAGIEVSTFIHEPFAAIVGYYFTRDNSSLNTIISNLQSLDGQYILTFDWGGGTLDITVVKIKDNKMIEVGTSELTGLAGDKFDEDIANWAWNKYLDKLGNKYQKEYLENIKKKKWDRLLAIAERCKIELSEENESLFLMETVIPNEETGIDEILTRDEFAYLISNTLYSACNKIDEAIKMSGINDINISHVLLTGGTCNIPVIQDKLKEKFGHRVEIIENADLVIAQGAAVVSEMGWMPFLSKDILLELSDNSYWPIFNEGMPISSLEQAKVTENLTCVDQRQKIAKLIIGEGFGQQKDATLAIINVPLLGDSRFGDDIYFEAIIDKDIILHINANSKQVYGYGTNENFSKRKHAEIYKMCFGLSIER